MAERVRMEHPDLPGRSIWVRPGGVAARRRAGWIDRPAGWSEQQETSRRRRALNEIEEVEHGTDAAEHDD